MKRLLLVSAVMVLIVLIYLILTLAALIEQTIEEQLKGKTESVVTQEWEDTSDKNKTPDYKDGQKDTTVENFELSVEKRYLF